jgi:hypothetical protein
MRATWNGLDRDAWDALHRTAAASLQQDWAYGEALSALGTRCLRAWVDDGGAPVCAAQFLVRKVAAIASIALCSHGPVWAHGATPDVGADAAAGTAPARRAEALRAIRASVPLRRPRVLLWTPDRPLAECAGFARAPRVMTGGSTVRIDLRREPAALRAAMHGKWRNRLAAAERSALKVVRVGGKPAQYRWLLERELAQRERRGYIALPDGFVEAWQVARRGPGGEDPVLTLRADLGRDAVAGMMFLVHGAAATYHVGWVGDAGRELGAHNLLLWHGLLALRERGVRSLDLGGVDTGRGAGLARFKIGTGGDVVTFGGTWA